MSRRPRNRFQRRRLPTGDKILPFKRPSKPRGRARFPALLPLLAAAVVGAVWWGAPDLSSPTAPAQGDRFACTVTKVHDGDGPLHCAEGPKVRLAAIAARELDGTCRPGHPCPDASAAEAKATLERLALGRKLSCEKIGTSYDRTTAWCWTSAGTQINCGMVRSDTAAYWKRYDLKGRLCAGKQYTEDHRRVRRSLNPALVHHDSRT